MRYYDIVKHNSAKDSAWNRGSYNRSLHPRHIRNPSTSVHLVQTHVSFIFITDIFVYKIKKPVDFGFLNFTTLDRRRFYCNEEVRLNRRLCPDMYLGVVEVRESPGGVHFDGEGKVIDYAVKMKRLPEERMLDRLLREGKVTDAISEESPGPSVSSTSRPSREKKSIATAARQASDLTGMKASSR